MGLPQPSFDTPSLPSTSSANANTTNTAPLDMSTEVTLPYPAKTKQSAITINGVHTDIVKREFSDKIMITASQEGRLATWVTTPLAAANPIITDPLFSSTSSTFDDPDALLPATRFTPITLLGAGNEHRENLARLYTSQIASLITTRDPGEGRGLLVGLGLDFGGRRRRVGEGGLRANGDGDRVNGDVVNGVQEDGEEEAEDRREREMFEQVIEGVLNVL